MRRLSVIAAAATIALSVTSVSSAQAAGITVNDLGAVDPSGSYNVLNNITIGSTINAPIVAGMTANYASTSYASNSIGWNPYGNESNPSQWISIGGAGGTASNGAASSIVFNLASAQKSFSFVWGSSSVTNTVSLYSEADGRGTLLGTVAADGNANLIIDGTTTVHYANLANTHDAGPLIQILSTTAFKSAVLSTGAGSGGFEIGQVSSVPLPAALPLFGAALFGLGALGRRRRAKA